MIEKCCFASIFGKKSEDGFQSFDEHDENNDKMLMSHSQSLLI